MRDLGGRIRACSFRGSECSSSLEMRVPPPPGSGRLLLCLRGSEPSCRCHRSVYFSLKSSVCQDATFQMSGFSAPSVLWGNYSETKPVNVFGGFILLQEWLSEIVSCIWGCYCYSSFYTHTTLSLSLSHSQVFLLGLRRIYVSRADLMLDLVSMNFIEHNIKKGEKNLIVLDSASYPQRASCASCCPSQTQRVTS